MTKLYLFIGLTLAVSCQDAIPKNEKQSQYKFNKCEEITYSIERCENKEVICYILEWNRRGGMSCKFKG